MVNPILGGGGGGEGGNLGVILVRMCGPVFLKPTPIIYLVFEKKMTYSYLRFIYLIEQNGYMFKYCPLIFMYPFAVCKQSLRMHIAVWVSELKI